MHIDDIAATVARRTPYYRNRYGDVRSLSDLQLLRKDEIVGREAEFLADGSNPESLFLYVTSGTTGMPLRLRQHRHEQARAAMSLWRARRWYGVTSPRMPSCRFYGFRRTEQGLDFARTHTAGATLSFSLLDLSDDALAEYYSALCAHRPIWFQAVPSALARLADWMAQRGRVAPDSLRLVELNGEMVTPTDRRLIESVFPSARVANNYGSAEVWCIAYECPAGSMHVLDDNVHLEVVDGEGRPASSGQVVVTSKHLLTMALLRYHLGDHVTVSPDRCSCGRDSAVLASVDGRVVDYAITTGGESVNPVFFLALVERINTARQGSVRRFRFIQRDLDIHAELELGPSWVPGSEEVLRGAFGEKFPGQKLHIDYGPVRITPGQKYRPFYREDA